MPRPAVLPEDTLEGVSELLQGWLGRLEELLNARKTAAPWHRAPIDEQIDQLCQEAAAEVEKSGRSKLSIRLQRMKQLVLDEMIELRDAARREDP